MASQPVRVAPEVIFQFFATQVAQDVSIDVLLARTADLVGRPVGVAGPLRRSAEPGGKILADLEPPPKALCRHLPSGETVWIAHLPADPPDPAILTEFTFAARVALIRHPPSRTRQELLDIACDYGADEHERVSALSALGFTKNALVRCLAVAGPPAGIERLAGTVTARSGRAVQGLRAGGPVTIVLAMDFPEAECLDVPVGAQVGISRALPAVATTDALHESLTALRFTQPSTRDRGPYLLEESCIVTAEVLGGNRVLAEHLSGPDLAAVPDVQALDALISAAGQEMLRTLDVVVASESYRKAAQRLHVHHNSVAQRMSRAERTLGFRISDPYGRNRLFVALLMRRLRDTSAFTRPGSDGARAATIGGLTRRSPSDRPHRGDLR